MGSRTPQRRLRDSRVRRDRPPYPLSDHRRTALIVALFALAAACFLAMLVIMSIRDGS